MGLRSNHYAQVENVHDRVINLEKLLPSTDCPVPMLKKSR